METQIPIYAAEIEAGIHGEIIEQAQAGVTHEAVCAIVDTAIDPKKLLEEVKPLAMSTDDNMAFASFGEHCMPFSSILCSDIWNKNGDVFTAGELIDTYQSARYQPINWQHHGSEARGNENIGVMVNSSLLKGDIENLEPFEAEDFVDLHCSDCTAQVHIRQDGIIWAYYFPSYASSIVKGIEDNNLFVSMECFYLNFGYALRLDANDTNYILVERDQSNAHLTAHLANHKGSGAVVYHGQNYQIARWLRGSSFSGQGIVDKPANAINGTILSVIFAKHKNVTKKKKKTTTYGIDAVGHSDVDIVNVDKVVDDNSVPIENFQILNNDKDNGYITTEGFSKEGVKNMTEQEITQLQTRLTQANDARDAALVQVAQLQESVLNAKADKLTKANEELVATNEKLETAAEETEAKLETVTALEAQVKTLTDEKVEIQTKLDDIAADTQGQERITKLNKLIADAYGEDDFEEIRDMSTEAFTALEKGLEAGVSSLSKLTDQSVSGQGKSTDQDVSGQTKLTDAATDDKDDKDDKKGKKKNPFVKDSKADEEAAEAIADAETEEEEADVQIPAEASDADAKLTQGRDLVRLAMRR